MAKEASIYQDVRLCSRSDEMKYKLTGIFVLTMLGFLLLVKAIILTDALLILILLNMTTMINEFQEYAMWEMKKDLARLINDQQSK